MLTLIAYKYILGFETGFVWTFVQHDTRAESYSAMLRNAKVYKSLRRCCVALIGIRSVVAL